MFTKKTPKKTPSVDFWLARLYCSFEKLSKYFENGHFCENSKLEKNGKFTHVQVHVTFFLFVLWKNREYESDAEFYEVFENDNHLSDSLN